MLGAFESALEEEGFFTVINAIKDKAKQRKENSTQNNGFPRKLDSKKTSEQSV